MEVRMPMEFYDFDVTIFFAIKIAPPELQNGQDSAPLAPLDSATQLAQHILSNKTQLQAKERITSVYI